MPASLHRLDRATAAPVNDNRKPVLSIFRSLFGGTKKKAAKHGHDFAHDSIRALGFDWSRVADPSVKGKYPLKVYLPQTTDDIVRAIRETKQLGQRLRIRGSGHSSNDLVLDEGGTILWTTLFTNILDIDTDNKRVVVQSGAMLQAVDEELGEIGFGFPVIGDHTHITAGGFASVGGVSPAAHREGMFVDNILAMEIVDWDGNVRVYSREESPLELNRVLGGTGQHGVIATLTLRIEPLQKKTTVVENDRLITTDIEEFITRSRVNIENPEKVLYQRAIWDERNVMGATVKFGQCSAYSETKQTAWKRLRERIAFGTIHTLRDMAGKLPLTLGKIANTLSGLGFLFTPRYATIKNIESFTEKVVDHKVGDPVRFLAVLAPMGTYAELFRKLHEISTRYRDQHACLTSISLYVVGLKSEWLAAGTGERYCDLLLYLGVSPDKLPSGLLEELVKEIDEACIEHRAFRYMHSRTSKAAELRNRIDANQRHIEILAGDEAEAA